MSQGLWRGILSRYGQPVMVYVHGNDSGAALHAFVQPMPPGKTPQAVPTPLGLRREDCFLYLGPPELPLQEGRSRVVWKEKMFEVQSAHVIGTQGAEHCWAVLRPRDQEAV